MSTNAQYSPNPTTPAYTNDYEYVQAYLAIHKMSAASYRYAYLLWFCILAVFFTFALFHWTGRRSSVLGAWWSKWSLRRRTWRKHSALEAAKINPKHHRQPFSFPSNAQLFSLFVLTVFTFLVSFVGPDYIAPSARLWQFHVYPSDSQTLVGTTSVGPNYTISKAWWTAGGRTGIISFALFPLVVLFALKSPPFALLSLPFFLQLHFDKLVRLHRWSGLILWLIVTIHVVTWGVQLANDRRGGASNETLWVSQLPSETIPMMNFLFGEIKVFVWQYNKFIYGVTAYFCLSLLALTSIPPIRNHYYEAFYFLHILLIPLTIVTSALHFPPIAWWCWLSLGIWMGERLWRLGRFAWINGLIGSPVDTAYLTVTIESDSPRPQQKPQPYHSSIHSSTYSDQFDVSMYATDQMKSDPPNPIPISDLGSAESSRIPKVPRGFAKAVLLPGRTIRLTLYTARPFKWSPGQHVLLRIPSVSKFTTHPFTIASVYNANSHVHGRSPHEIVLLVRAKAGFTRELWNEVSRLTTLQYSPVNQISSPSGDFGSSQSGIGVLLKAQMDGPFGSASRARWGNYSSILIITGGSGVSYGIAILDFLCRCMSGQNSESLGSSPGGWGYEKFQTSRVRFVWLIREFSHIQWCALAISQCLGLIPRHALQVEIYVANISRAIHQEFHPPLPVETNSGGSARDIPLDPPIPSFVGRKYEKRNSWASASAESDDDSLGPETPTSSVYSDAGFAERRIHPLDLTNFDGDDDSFIPGEARLSYQVHKEGRIRRRASRRSVNRGGSRVLLPETLYSAQSPLSPIGENELSASHSFHGPPLETLPMSSGGKFNNASHTSRTYSHVPRTASQYHANFISDSKAEVAVRESFSPTSRLPPMMTDEEYAMSVVSELTRSGKPQLHQILAEEVERSEGSVGVACCGPISLNALVRKTVAANIDPRRIKAGDPRGSITLISEEFEY